MNQDFRRLAVFTLLCGIVLPLSSQEKSLQELQQRCEDAREEKIAPLREKAIEECIEQRKNNRTTQAPREQCERFYSDFGDGTATASGGFRQPMFNDLPECVEFREAEREQRSSNR